jgi:MoxR-like ATPase
VPDENHSPANPVERFHPNRVERRAMPGAHGATLGPDRRGDAVYFYHDQDIELAVNAALVTGRALLVSGPSGCGKSSLALNAALTLGRRYYEYVVTSKSEARDLLYQFDAVRRLNDANVNQAGNAQAYVEPGPLWWALDPASACQRGHAGVLKPSDLATDPSPSQGAGAVVLIDEIDKAEPDFPNNLLVPIGSLTFTVAQSSFRLTGGIAPLVMITNNAERDLPIPFLRRCIALTLPELTQEKLIEIAKAHIAPNNHQLDLFRAVAERVMRLARDETIEGAKQRLSAAEYLDTVRACQELGIDTKSRMFERLSRITLRKSISATPENS